MKRFTAKRGLHLTLVARDNSSGTTRTYKSLYPYDPFDLAPKGARTATLGGGPVFMPGTETTLSVRRNYGDEGFELLDLTNGTRRLVSEPGVVNVNNIGITEDGTFWLSASYYADPSNYVQAPSIGIF